MSAGIALSTSVGIALAGTDGQQMLFHDDDHDSSQVCFYGTNQHGNPKQVCEGEVSWQAITTGYWWIDSMKMVESNGQTWYTSVPLNQPSSNYYCFDDSTGRASGCD